MACNENVIKNMASEASRNCQAKNVNVEVGFVVYVIEFLLLNPKYGKLFTKTLNRNNLEYFVNEVVTMLTRSDTSIRTLKMQFVIYSNYDKPANLIARHVNSIENCMRPLVNEILDAEASSSEPESCIKLYRKMSIYILLTSGLGNPTNILMLKEALQALESVFTVDEVPDFVALPRNDKGVRLNELVGLVSGVRLFNKHCKLTGELLPDLPVNLTNAGKGCIQTLSHSLIGVMQRVNALSTAISDCIYINEETGNVSVEVATHADLTMENYDLIFDLLAFNRQYEMFIRKLLADMQGIVESITENVEKCENVLLALHEAVKFKEAVPVAAVFPLFIETWDVWRAMQSIMYVVSTVNLMAQTLASIQEHTKIPQDIVAKMLHGRVVATDQERMIKRVSIEQHLSLVSLPNYEYSGEQVSDKHKHPVQFLGFCAMCLVAGALTPSSPRIGVIKHNGKRYGFCAYKMAVKFSKDPQRYLNEILEYARNNPHIINLLNIIDDVRQVKDVDELVVKYIPKILKTDESAQTELHPVESYKDRHYTWDIWEVKRQACQWANLVNCRTHSTQTDHSHMRSDIQCQTVEPRNKILQTKKDTGMNTNVCDFFLWGLRGQLGDGQHAMSFVQPHGREMKKPHEVMTCSWPCIELATEASSSSGSSMDSEEAFRKVMSNMGNFYDPSAAPKKGLFRVESRMVDKKWE